MKFIYCLLSFFFILDSCSLDPQPCDTPVNTSVGVNDTFSITPLKTIYNGGEKIIVKFTIDNNAKLQFSNNKSYNIFEITNDDIAIIHSGLEINQDLARLVSNSKNSIRVIYGEKHNNGYKLKYNDNLKKYILELEVTLLDKREYNLKLDEFSIIVNLGKKDIGENCRYYEHFSSIEINPTISFQVQ